MFRRKTFWGFALAASLALCAAPAFASEKFVDSKDAKEKDEPQKFLKDYDKLTKGKDADWVYFPNGSLKSFHTVTVKDTPQARGMLHAVRHLVELKIDPNRSYVRHAGTDLLEPNGVQGLTLTPGSSNN